MAEKTSLSRREQSRHPFDFFTSDLDRFLDDLGFAGLSRQRSKQQGALEGWTPQIEVTHQNNELVVRADLPGLKKDDISVDVMDEAVTISGERRQEQESDSGGYYRSERRYGSFYRTVPLPHGAMSDQAKATFKDGVLEVRVPAPPEQVTRGRRIEIDDTTQSKK